MLIPVAEIPGSKPESRSLWWLRVVATYCVGAGAMHVFGLLRVLDLARAEGHAPAWPIWLFATSYIYPLARIAAGMLLLSRSRFAPASMVVTTLCAASSLFVLPAVWAKQIGFEIPYAPMQVVISRLDFIIMLAITWGVFRWRAQGLLRSNEASSS